jgi:hypothetical protein
MKKWIICFAMIPILGWLASLVHNLWLGGKLFYYSDIAYMPLIVVTFPFEGLLRWLSDLFGEHTHRVIFVYTLVCAVIYGLVGVGIGRICRRGVSA